VDQFPTAIPAWVTGLLGAWLVLGGGVYYSVVRIVKAEGKVSVQEFKEADLIVCVAFISWIVLNIAGGFGKPDRDVTQKEIIYNAAAYMGIVAMIFIFLQYRGINPLRQFGFLRRNVFLCAGLAAGLIVAAHPLVLLVEWMTAAAMHGAAQPQNVVEFFMNASEKADTKAICIMLLLAGVVAPIAEETIFRGYLYGVLKRYMGGIAAGVVTAGLFAALHMNLAALPALFVLALCLTLAYEATGSLLVNIFMHGFFNLSMLLLMLYLTAHGVTP
jgi:uncharacterized protein